MHVTEKLLNGHWSYDLSMAGRGVSAESCAHRRGSGYQETDLIGSVRVKQGRGSCGELPGLHTFSAASRVKVEDAHDEGGLHPFPQHQ